MSFSELFIRRPVMTTLVMFGILIFGLVAYRALPVSDLPAVDYPTISVSASLPGASPETMASAVATPLEKEFSTIPGIETMTSTSTQGVDLDLAAVRAQPQHRRGRAGRAGGHLPGAALAAAGHPATQLPEGGSVLSPILYYALRTKTLPLSQLNEYAETFLAQRLSTVDGVAQVQVFGSMKYAVRIQLDPQQLAARRIGIDEVATAVDNGNVNLPTGILWGTDKAYSVESQGQLMNAKDFGAPGRGVSRRCPGPAAGSRPGGGQRAGHQAGELVQRRAGGGARDPAAAGHQYRRRGGAGEGGSAGAAEPDSAGRGDRHAQRPLGHGEGVGERREVHALPGALPRGDGDLPLSPEHARHRDPQPRASDVHRRARSR